jgi:hypothetical protein
MSVRWDAVVDRTRIAAYGRPVPPRPVAVPPDGRVRAHVQLFGALASASAERSFQLELAAGTTIAEALGALGRRLGEPFLARVLDENGAKHRYCRLFVAGEAAEDLQAALDAHADPTEIEIILLIAPEGG